MAGAAIVIGALVPATIMCIGAANLLASNVFREFSAARGARRSTRSAKCFTLVMCAGGLFFIFFVPVTYAIDFQLLGGALMLSDLSGLCLRTMDALVSPARAAGRMGGRR